MLTEWVASHRPCDSVRVLAQGDLPIAIRVDFPERVGLDPESLLKASELGLLGALVGARLYYVLFNLDYYTQFPRKILAVWEGGLAIHGGIIGGILVGGGYAYLRRLPVRTSYARMLPGAFVFPPTMYRSL